MKSLPPRQEKTTSNTTTVKPYLEVILLSVHAKDATLMKQRFFSMQGNAQCSKESGKIPSLQMQENMT